MPRLNMLLSRNTVRQLLLHLLIVAGYFVVALCLSWPALTTLSTHFIGSETGDSYEMARHIWWFGYALQEGEPLLYQTYLGYPDGVSGTVFTTLPLQYLPAALFALLMPLPLAYNLHVLLWMALNGWSMVMLMRYLLPDDNNWLPALLAGLVFMAHPIFQGHLHEGHGGLMVMWPVPLYVWSLLHLMRSRTRTQMLIWLAASVLFFYLSTTGHILQAIYVLLPLTGVLFLVQMRRREWQSAARLVLMGVVSVLVTLPVFWPAIDESLSERAYAETGGYVAFSTDLLGIVSPSFFHPVFDALLDYPRAVLGTNLGEGAAYIGIVALILAVSGFITVQKSRQWALVGGVAWVLSLGPLLKVLNQPVQVTISEYTTYIPLPFAALQQLPGVSLARTPGRFTFTVALALAILAGYGAAYYLRKRPGRAKYALAVLLSALILFEYRFFWPMPTLPADVPQAITEIRNRDDAEAVFNVPHQHLLAAKDALYLQTAHQTPLLAGQITRQTPVNPAKLDILQQTLNPPLLQSAGVDVVIHHRQREVTEAPDLAERLQAELGEPFFQNPQYALYNVPETDAAPPGVLLSDYHAAGQLKAQADIPFYVGQSGWYLAEIDMPEARPVLHLALNDRHLNMYAAESGTRIEQPLYLSEPGYHTLQLQLEPPCPPNLPDMACRGVTYDTTLTASSGEAVDSIQFVDGIYLRAGQVTQPYTDDSDNDNDNDNESDVVVRLAWEFDSTRSETDVRFVHLINADGELVAQDDSVLGRFEAGDSHTEQLTLLTENLPAGVYRVRAGWYAYDPATDTITNYPTASGDPASILADVDILSTGGD